MHAGSRNVRLASQVSAESHQNGLKRNSLHCVRSSRVSNSNDAARPDLAILCCEEVKELLASAAKEVLRLDELLVLLNFLQFQLKVVLSQLCVLVSQSCNLIVCYIGVMLEVSQPLFALLKMAKQHQSL